MCVAALLKDLALEKISLDRNRTVTSAVVDLFLQSPTAETLSHASFYNVDAFTSAGILRLARGCPCSMTMTLRSTISAGS